MAKMPIQVIQPSFTAGELSPSLFARIDLDKYHSGAARLKNFFVDYRGGARNRSGTRWAGQTKGPINENVRLVRWAFNEDQTYVLEFGHHYIRFLQRGGYILEASKAITAVTNANPGVFTSAAHSFNNDDWVYVSGVVGMTELNGRFFRLAGVTANTAQLLDPNGINVSTLAYHAYVSGGTVARVYTVTTTYNQLDIFSLRFTQAADVMTITHTGYVAAQLTRTAHTSWTLANITFGANQVAPVISGATSNRPAGNTKYRYGVTAINADTGSESVKDTVDISLDQTPEEGPFRVTVNWAAAAGADRYFVYRSPYGKDENTVPANTLLGFIGATKGTGYADRGGTSDFSVTPPDAKDPFAAGKNPLCSTYFQSRQVYAGTLAKPETIWTSQVGNFANMNFSFPTRKDDAIEITLASMQVNAIKYMIPMPGGLLAFTTGGVWQVSGGGVNTPITPSNAIATPQGYNGIGELPPIPTNFNILYVQKSGSIVRDLSYNFFVNIYQSQDITVLSSHLFLGHQIVDWTFAEEPWKMYWLVREDGKLLSLTYMEENQVYAWTQHETLGLVRSVCSINEEGEDYLYLAIERFVGNQWVRYVERMESRVCPHGLVDSWFLDSALEYPLTFPAFILQPGAVTGTNVTFIAAGAAFTSGMVGNVIRFRDGIGVITSYVSASSVKVNIISPFPGLEDATPIYAESGEWSCTAPDNVINGLWHLEGKTVTALADGGVVENLIVANGAVTLPAAASRVIVGLPYKSQLQTLPLDVGDQNQIARRKKIPAVEIRVESTRGIKAGGSFDDLTEMKLEFNPAMGQPSPLVSDDVRIVIDTSFDRGMICIEQSFPLPASILGVIPEVWIGDS